MGKAKLLAVGNKMVGRWERAVLWAEIERERRQGEWAVGVRVCSGEEGEEEEGLELGLLWLKMKGVKT